MFVSPVLLNWAMSCEAGVGAVAPKSVSVALVCAVTATGIKASVARSNAINRFAGLPRKRLDDLHIKSRSGENAWFENSLFETKHRHTEVFMRSYKKRPPMSF